MTALSDTLTVHESLDALVAAARRAAAHGDTSGARAAVRRAWGLFASHREVEERTWIPLYAERCGPFEPGVTCSPAILLRDHRIIAGHFAHGIGAEGLALVDRLEDLAGALEHHDLRERSGFKPVLDAALSDAERSTLLVAHDREIARDTEPRAGDPDPWTRMPVTAITPIRETVLRGDGIDGIPDLPEGPFRTKVARQLAGLDLGDRVDALARLRRVGWMLAARQGLS